MEIFRHLNWIDLLMVAVLIRAIYIGIKRGFVDEFFHLVGVVVTIFVVFHYYPLVSSFLERRTFLSVKSSNWIAYLFLWGVVALLAKLIRDGFRIIFKVETVSFVNKCGGFLVCFGRAILLASLIIWFLFITGHTYIQENIRASVSGSRLAQAGTILYQKTFEGFVVKLFPDERLNREIIISHQGFSRKKNR